MSDYGSSLERIREAEAVASRLERALAENPDDLALELDFLSANHMARKLHDEFVQSAPELGIDVCSYRIVPEYTDDYSVAGVTSSLKGFQDLFSLIFAALRLGPRSTAHVPADIASMSALSVGYTFAGSLGVVLTVGNAKTLFGDLFDETVKAICGLTDLTNPDQVRFAAQKYGKASVTKFYERSKSNYDRSYSVDVKWKGTDGNEQGRS